MHCAVLLGRTFAVPVIRNGLVSADVMIAGLRGELTAYAAGRDPDKTVIGRGYRITEE